jgi:stage V sporulation protein SpoVS
MSSEPIPLKLSDSQMSAILQACAPLARPDRDAFVCALANVLRSELQPLGDGAVHRAVRALQREFFRPPRVAGTVRRTGPASDPGPAIE